MGIRKASTHEEDFKHVKPLHVIVAGLLILIILVILLVLVAKAVIHYAIAHR